MARVTDEVFNNVSIADSVYYNKFCISDMLHSLQYEHVVLIRIQHSALARFSIADFSSLALT